MNELVRMPSTKKWGQHEIVGGQLVASKVERGDRSFEVDVEVVDW